MYDTAIESLDCLLVLLPNRAQAKARALQMKKKDFLYFRHTFKKRKAVRFLMRGNRKHSNTNMQYMTIPSEGLFYCSGKAGLKIISAVKAK